MTDHAAGQISDEQLRAVQNEALRETIARLEETGSP
jgi:5-methyltetrahydropteroyltriglutamate--homocysteine methyltransferase